MRPAFAEYWSLRHSAGGHLVTRNVSQRLGAACAWLAQQAGLTPSHVTLLGTAMFLLGAALFASQPDGTAGILCALPLSQLGYRLDCADVHDSVHLQVQGAGAKPRSPRRRGRGSHGDDSVG